MSKNIFRLSIGAFVMFMASISYAGQLTHQFKSPAFSGQGYSAHVLTIENQEFSRKKANREKKEAAERQAATDEANTNLAKFMKNVESRIYAQLSKQLVDNMFGNEEASLFGQFALEGNDIRYERIQDCKEDGICTEIIRLTIIDEDGSTTTIDIPIGTGGF